MDQVIPWATVEARVDPHFPKAGRGLRPRPMMTMLRIHFLQPWLNLSDPQTEDLHHEPESTRRFARIDLLHDTVPEETAICKFRHLLEAHRLTARMFDAVKALLKARKLLPKAGTTADAATADITPLPHLLIGQEKALHGDKAYYKADDKLLCELSGHRFLVKRHRLVPKGT